MKQVPLELTVEKATETIKKSLEDKGFTIFCDVDHQANANNLYLDMPSSRVLIFGNPVAGTKLMQKDITMSIDLPLRLAIIDKDGQTLMIHQTTEDYCMNYQVEGHPVLEKVESLFSALASELSK